MMAGSLEKNILKPSSVMPTNPPDGSAPRKPHDLVWAGRVFMAALAIIVLLVLSGLFDLLAVPLTLAFWFAAGWIFALPRLTESWHWSSALWWWVGGCVALAIGVHWFLRTIRRQAPQRLRLRTSLALLSLAWLAIFAGMSLAGSVHQVGWLAGTQEPLFGSPRSERLHTMNLLSSAARAAHAIVQEHSSFDAWQREWKSDAWFSTGSPLAAHQNFASRVIVDAHGKVATIYLWPRDGKVFQAIGGVAITAADERPRQIGASDLARELQRVSQPESTAQP